MCADRVEQIPEGPVSDPADSRQGPDRRDPPRRSSGGHTRIRDPGSISGGSPSPSDRSPGPAERANRSERVRALRGATTLDRDDREEVLLRTRELLDELLSRNGLCQDDMVSVVFTATDDITSAFPAEAARQAGINLVPLLCARELAIEGGIARCIRVLAHIYTTQQPSELRHVYLRDARQLRTDLPE